MFDVSLCIVHHMSSYDSNGSDCTEYNNNSLLPQLQATLMVECLSTDRTRFALRRTKEGGARFVLWIAETMVIQVSGLE